MQLTGLVHVCPAWQPPRMSETGPQFQQLSCNLLNALACPRTIQLIRLGQGLADPRFAKSVCLHVDAVLLKRECRFPIREALADHLLRKSRRLTGRNRVRLV